MSGEPAPGTPELLTEPFVSRWSPRDFDPAHVLDDADLRAVLTAAQWAPSWGNSQPWSFVVVHRGGPGHDVLVRHLSDGNRAWVPRASAVVLGCTDVHREFPDFARYDLGQAAAHLTLQARALGLHAHQFGGYDRAAVARGLGVPDGVEVMAGIALGARGGEPDEHKPRVRRPLDETVHVGRWGRVWTAED